jgi:hypothetical protein
LPFIYVLIHSLTLLFSLFYCRRCFCSEETSDIFLKAAAQLQSQGITFNDATIQAKKQAERDKEAARAAALASAGGAAAKTTSSSSSILAGGGFGGKGGPMGGGVASASKVDDDFAEPEL